MSHIINGEKPFVVVGSVSKGKGIEDRFVDELDMVAKQADSLGFDVLRYKGAWPRNAFFSLPNKIFHSATFAINTPDTVLSDHGLLINLDNALVVSDFPLRYLFVNKRNLRKKINTELGKEVVFFKTTPRIWNLFGFDYTKKSITFPLGDLDYIARVLPSLNSLVTYERFLDRRFNSKALDQLAELGYSEHIVLPTEEFYKFPVGFCQWGNPEDELILMDKGCDGSVDILKNAGANVVETWKPIKSLNIISHFNYINNVRGGIHCVTNELYPSSIPILPQSLREKIMSLDDYGL